ncbi:glycosyltransferase family 2 protein [Leuconostoc mesenteroides]|uniref:glycosyltransferase family 2 protein n=1 Tax=Leuconostoc mesenteroides TaxID=1245 RepID=UPI0032DF4515
MKNIFVILNYNDYRTTVSSITTLMKYENVDGIVIVDNCSTNNSFDFLKVFESQNTRVIQTKSNEGYAVGNNIGIKEAKRLFGKDILIFLMNPDVLVSKYTITKLSEFYEHCEDKGKLGLFAPRVKSLNGSVVEGAFCFATFRNLLINGNMVLKRTFLKNIGDQHYNFEINSGVHKVDVLSGAFTVGSYEVYQSINFFDDKTFLYFEEEILAYKIRSIGRQNYQLTNVFYEHIGGTSTPIKGRNIFRKLNWEFQSQSYFVNNYLKLNSCQKFILKMSYNFNRLGHLIKNKIRM